jgi:hypothetical protein
MPITACLRRSRDLQQVFVAIHDGLPVHILSHGWEIKYRGLQYTLVQAIEALRTADYKLVVNREFFEETLP